MTVKDIIKETGLHINTVRIYLEKGIIKGKKVTAGKYGHWKVSEKDFDQYLLSRRITPPDWYYLCKLSPVNPLGNSNEDNITAKPHQVCIKNVLPILTKDQYLEVCRRSEERNL